MCGKFTAMVSWGQIVEYSALFTQGGGEGESEAGDDSEATFRVNGPLPVIVWDRQTRQRKVVAMRWGFPHPQDWRRPQPIHARAETVEAREPFGKAFHDGQRGIVVFRTFNEGEEVTTPSGRTATRQWTIDPGDGRPRGFAFVWRRFEIPGLPEPLLACVMVTVPANELIRRNIKQREDDPRMPAILADGEAWETWLGERSAETADVKAMLKTMEGVTWTTAPEPRKPPPRKR
jgi:putative SOS response-associated peptidase YedK